MDLSGLIDFFNYIDHEFANLENTDQRNWSRVLVGGEVKKGYFALILSRLYG